MAGLQKSVLAIVGLALLAATGCKQPYDYTMQRNRIFLLGRLVVGKTCDVRLIWRKAPEDAEPVTVTADLSQIGGDAAQALTATGSGIWRWTGQIVPDAAGERIVSITSVDNQQQAKKAAKRFPVFSSDKTVAIGVGDYIYLAVRADGTVVLWQYGDNASSIMFSSVAEGLSDVVAVTASQNLSYGSIGRPDLCFALKADGTVVEWGDNETVEAADFVPMPPGLADIVAIARSAGHSLALKADGTVVAWGDNTYAESAVPAGLTDVVAIAAGLSSSFALRADGTLAAWGMTSGGAPRHEKITAVSASRYGCIYVIDECGAASLTGSNPHECGDVPVRAGGRFTAVTAGLGLRNTGAVVSWAGSAFVNEGPGNILAIAGSGGSYGVKMALADDGTVSGFVDAWYGLIESPIPDELK